MEAEAEYKHTINLKYILEVFIFYFYFYFIIIFFNIDSLDEEKNSKMSNMDYGHL